MKLFVLSALTPLTPGNLSSHPTDADWKELCPDEFFFWYTSMTECAIYAETEKAARELAVERGEHSCWRHAKLTSCVEAAPPAEGCMFVTGCWGTG